MSESVPVHVSVGDPEDVEFCPECLLPSLVTYPMAGIWEGGVIAMSSLTICEECGLPQKAVADYLARNGYDSPPQ